jgi:hypothetical protein
LLLAILVCELILQLIAFVPSPRLRALREPALDKRLLDAELGHRGNPVWREYDASGFRNADRPEMVSIVAIGDSQTESQSVSRKNAWPQQLEALSGRRTYNMGLAGFGPAHYYALTDEALALSPDLILVALYSGNDFADAYLRVFEGGFAPELRADDRRQVAEPAETGPAAARPDGSHKLRAIEFRADLRDTQDATSVEPRTVTAAGAGGPSRSGQQTDGLAEDWHRAQRAADPSRGDWKRSVSEFAKHRIRLFGLVRTLYRSAFVRLKLDRDNRPARWSTMRERAEAVDDDVLFAIERGPIRTVLTPASSLSLLDRQADPRIAEGWQVTLRAIRAMRERIVGRAALMVLFIPTKELVYATWLQREAADLDFPPALERLVSIETALWRDTAAALDDDGIEYLDLLPALVKCLEAGEWPYNNDDDGHPILCGNRAIAQAVADAALTSVIAN